MDATLVRNAKTGAQIVPPVQFLRIPLFGTAHRQLW